MPFELMVGPPASGKTSRALERARRVAAGGGSVWWVGLPNQRTEVYRRATADGGVLGLEFLTAQQVAYRLLAAALRLRPLVVGSDRLVRIGEALAEVDGALPAPGEARLFAYAISEAKRFGLSPGDLPVHDAVSERLREVFEAYERVKGSRWDYDDARVAALELVRGDASPPEVGTPGRRADGAPRRDPRPPAMEADLIVVDGLREVGPLDLALYRALGAHADVLLCLPAPPPGAEPHVRLQAESSPDVRSYRAPNPVAEARWVLRSLKRDLAEGCDPLDLAVILPPGRAAGFAMLAEEYGVPVMDEAPVALADLPAGRRLVDLLELARHPTAARLLAVPDLEPLARAVLEAGVSGAAAVVAVAEACGSGEAWARWQARLTPDGEDWPERVTSMACAAEADPEAARAFAERALRRAEEAGALATGTDFVTWWIALLQEPDVHPSTRGGVALMGPVQASGRRFRRVYLMHAVSGAYDPEVAEDWFLPEEVRLPWPDVFTNPDAKRLPRRLRGSVADLYDDLRTRGDIVLVTFPEADRDGPLEPAEELVREPQPLPAVPAGSRAELAAGATFTPSGGLGRLARPTVERLRRYAECGFRTWAEDLVGSRRAAERPWWKRVRDGLRSASELDDARLDQLMAEHPEAAAWLAAHAPELKSLTYGVRLDGPGGSWAEVDAARRDGGAAVLYRFGAPGLAATPREASDAMDERWAERWAAGRLLMGYGGKIERVDVRLWPILGDPIDAYAFHGVDSRVRRVLHAAENARERFAKGEIRANPGWQCTHCGVADICRVGRR